MGESYLTGAYGSFADLVDPILTESDLYLLADLDREREVTLLMLGTRHHGEIIGADWTIEGGYQFGETCPVNISPCGPQAVSVQAYFFDVEAGYKIVGLRPYLGLSMASGDDPDTETFEGYTQFYPTAHKWLGLMDIIGPRTNLREIRAGLSYAHNWFSTALAAHHFTRQTTGESAGQEFNLTASTLLSEGLQLQAGHGLFLPGPAISQSNDEPQGIANWSFLQLVASF